MGEGVDGSSPSEGLSRPTKPLQKAAFLLPVWTLSTSSLPRRGSTVWPERTTQRVAGRHNVWSHERARSESWGQVLGD